MPINRNSAVNFVREEALVNCVKAVRMHFLASIEAKNVKSEKLNILLDLMRESIIRRYEPRIAPNTVASVAHMVVDMVVHPSDFGYDLTNG